MPIGGNQIPVRGLTGGEGKVGEKVQGLTAGHGAGRCWGREGLWQRVNGEQGRAAVLCDIQVLRIKTHKILV
jgi:hypothetical protein